MSACMWEETLRRGCRCTPFSSTRWKGGRGTYLLEEGVPLHTIIVIDQVGGGACRGPSTCGRRWRCRCTPSPLGATWLIN